jgi:hypothetical protein
VIFIHTGTGIDIQLSLHLLLSQLEQLLALKLNIEQQAQEGSLQRLRLLNLESADVANAGSLGIPGIVQNVWLIFDD